MKKYPFRQKIVTLGGGTGHFSLLRGLAELNQPDLITAVAGTWDNGGSSGRLRTELGVLPPGDIRQCLLALMENPDQRDVAQKLFDDRLAEVNGPLKGHSLGNLITSRLDHIYKGLDRGTDAARNLFRIRAKVLPVTLTDLNLVAKLSSGQEIEGETNIDNRGKDPDFNPHNQIIRIYFTTNSSPNPEVVKALKEADKIVFSSGDLYTSILPHLLIPSIKEVVMKSKARLYLVLNLMTKRGETDYYKASDFLKAFLYYLEDNDRIDFMVVNNRRLDPEILKIYQTEGQEPIELDKEFCQSLAGKLKIIEAPLATYLIKEHLLRHDPESLAKAVLEHH